MRITWLLLAVVALVASVARPLAAEELIVCGWDEVFVIDVGEANATPPAKIWSWRAAECSNLPEAWAPLFRTTDDCKPVAQGRQILITSSGGAVALVDRQTKEAVFYARAANAHSADLLPGNRVAVAASVSDQGNRLIVFAPGTPGEELWSDRLYSAHGAVWDNERKLLWALGDDQLRGYRLLDWDGLKPRLELAARHTLPEGGGHDLSPVPASPELIVTTSRHVYRFNRDRPGFQPFEKLADRESVKGVSIHPTTGRVAFVQAERPEWWSDDIGFLNPDGRLTFAGERLYKARWNAAGGQR